MIVPTDDLKLKSCPFCGKTPKLDSKYHFVSCINGFCACLPNTWHYETDEEAIEAWNRRVKE